MSAIPYPQTLTSERSAKWIINQREDLIWFIGSALTGYLVLLLMTSTSAVFVALVSLLFTFGINLPHFYSTVTRTYFDREARRKNPYLLLSIVPFVILCPVTVWFLGFKPLVTLGMFWGALHVSKQHFGFVAIYKKKAADFTDFKLDKNFTLFSLITPFVLFNLNYLSVPLRYIAPIALLAQLAFAAVYLRRQIVKYTAGQVMNWPKLQLLAAFIPLHWLAFYYATSDPLKSIAVFGIATSIGHSFQYMRLTWFHNKNRYQGRRERHGLASLVSSRAYFFYAAVVIMGAIVVLPKFSIEPGNLWNALFIAPTLTHYLIDSKIWRTREDPELAKALNL